MDLSLQRPGSQGPAERHRRAGVAAVVGLALLAAVWPAARLPADGPPGKLARFGDQPQLAKVSGRLLEARRQLLAGKSPREVAAAVRRLPIRGRLVAIQVRLDRLDATLEALLVEAGLVDSRFYAEQRTATGRIDLERLDELVAIPEVAVVKERRPPRRRAGAVTSQGDGSIRADQARAAFSVDGTGVKVGILSDSFNELLGASPSGSGCTEVINPGTSELPASVVLLDDCTAGSPNCDFLVDEGRALGEIVHDLAPGAELLFHSGFNSELDFAGGVAQLRSCGADVIFDDVIFEDEPMFQDGQIGNAVQAAVDAGVAYLSAAGNDADFGVDDVYTDIAPGTDDPGGGSGDDFHDFGGGDAFASISVADGCGFTALLQWNEPFDSPLGPGASTDLDLLLCVADNAVSCASLFEGQGCGVSPDPTGDPSEVQVYENDPNAGVPGARETVYLAIDEYCDEPINPPDTAVSPLRMRVVIFADGPGCSLGDAERGSTVACAGSTADYCFEAGVFVDPQIYGHPATAGALAVAASYYEEIDSGGSLDPPGGQIDVQPFSSLGGDLPFYYDGSGNPLGGAPVSRFKPEITAPDGVNTSFFGADLPDDPDADPNFVGTSAAVPHAAAVAALMLDHEPTLTGIDIGHLLACTARDIETAGKDALSGHGLIDAVDALAALTPTITVHKSATLTTNVNDANELDDGDVLTYSYEVTNTSAVTLESLEVSDAHAGLSAITCGATTLAPGAMTTCSATYTVSGADVSTGSITNDATATGLACGASAAEGSAMDSLTLPICELDRVLADSGSVNGPVAEEACQSLATDTLYTILSGSVTFRAGQTILLDNGFSVAAGATFTAYIDPDLDLD